MDYNKLHFEQLDRLLQKYWEGETSIAEEREIKLFFQENRSLPPKYESVRIHFDFATTTQSAKLSDGFENKVLEQIQKGENRNRTKVVSFNFRKVLSAAATVLMIAGIGWWTINQLPTGKTQAEVLMTIEKNGKIIEITDPQRALEVTQIAFSAINRGMKEGNKSLKHIKPLKKTRIFK